MIVNDRITDYIQSLETSQGPEAELDGEDIYMEEEESGGWIEEAEE